jgi:3-methyladenine DNA glycosylase/8-oxoguanine DNA glycosylase
MESVAPGMERAKRMRLAVSGPYDVCWMLDFFARRAVPELEGVAQSTYRRRVGPDQQLTVRVASDALSVSFSTGLTDRVAELRRDVRRLFDLDADSALIDAHLAGDPLLHAAVRRSPGLRVPGTLNGFELAVRAILGQQVSVTRATTLAGLLVRRYGGDGHGGYRFPSAECLARQTPAEIGMPGRRGEAIRRLAEIVARGDVDISPAMDGAALRGALTAVAGIGPWTAEYIAMRAGRDADAFPDSDWVICKQLGTNASGARRAAQAWRPFRAYAVMYLWSSAARRQDA